MVVMDLFVKALRESYSFASCFLGLKLSTNKKSVDTTHTLWGVRRPRHLQDRCLRRSVEQSTLFLVSYFVELSEQKQ